eukprot:2894180-Prymnesium_polylepis.1
MSADLHTFLGALGTAARAGPATGLKKRSLLRLQLDGESWRLSVSPELLRVGTVVCGHTW